MKNTFDEAKLPTTDIYFFRQRLKNKIFQSALAYFAEVAKERNLTKKDIAKLLDKDPAQITRWFSGPNNWTLDTISDLLLAMGAEMKHEIVSLDKFNQDTTDFENAAEFSVNPGVPRGEARTDSALNSIQNKNPLQCRNHADTESQESRQQISLESDAQADLKHLLAQSCRRVQRIYIPRDLPL